MSNENRPSDEFARTVKIFGEESRGLQKKCCNDRGRDVIS